MSIVRKVKTPKGMSSVDAYGCGIIISCGGNGYRPTDEQLLIMKKVWHAKIEY